METNTIMKELCFLLTILCAFQSILMANNKKDSSQDAFRHIVFRQKIYSLKKGLLLNQKVWIKNNAIRFQKKQNKWDIVTIVKNKKIYNYFLQRRVGTIMAYDQSKKFPFQMNPLVFQNVNAFYEYLNSVHAKKIKTVMMNGQQCQVFRFAVPDYSFVTTIWMASDDFPLKSQCKTPHDIVTIYYDNIKINNDIDDQLFVIPDNVHFQNIANLL